MRMKWLAVAAIMLFPAWSFALVSPPLADRVPGDALLYVGWTGSQSLPAAYDASHLKAVLDESSLPELFQTLLPQLIAKVSPKDREAAEVMRLISAIGGPLWRHPSAIYFGGIDWTNGPPVPQLAVLCDAGDEADALARELTRILNRAGQGGPPIIARRYGSLVVLAFGAPAAVDKMFANPPADALLKSAAFANAMQQVQSDAITAVYVDIQGLIKTVDDSVQRVGDQQALAIWPKIRDGLGLTGFKQTIWTGGFDGRDWCVQGFVGTDGGKKGLLSMFNAPPLTDDALAVVPKTANRVVAGHFDLAALVREVRTGIESIDPNIADQFDQLVSQANAHLGIDIQKELLDPLGDQWVLYTDRAVGGPGLLGAVVVNKLRDAKQMEASLGTVVQRSNQMIAQALRKEEVTIQFRETTHDGLTVHYLAVPFVSPAWTVREGNLFLALYPQIIDSASSQVITKGDSILQNDAYIAMMKRLGDHKASGITFSNLPETAPDGYALILAISRLYLGFADMYGIQTPAMVLPPLHRLLPHITPSAGASWSDDAGWHCKSISSFPGSEMFGDNGMGPAMVGEGALMTSIMLPSLNRARETANRVKCASNERMIGQALLLYANENKGKYPDDMGTLIKTEDIVTEVFICPSGDNAVPPDVAAGTVDQKVAWVNEHADYVYLGKGQTSSAPAERIIVYEKPGAHEGDGMNILYGDGHVEWQTTAEATRQIELQEKKGEQGL